MSKVLLINSPIRLFAPPNNPPLGVMYLAATLRKDGHYVEILDLNACRSMIDDREYWLRKRFGKWDYIGLSGLIVTYAQQRWILDFIMEHYIDFGTPTLMTGGGLASSAPEFVKRKMPELHCIVQGEGERTITEIVNSWKPYWEVKGMSYRGPGGWVDSEPQDLIDDLDSIPFPAWDLVPMEEVYLGNPIWGKGAGNSSQIKYEAKRSVNMVVSRGCPNKCAFCQHYVLGKKYRQRSVDNVIAEIQALRGLYDIDFVGFVDDNTTARKTWTQDLCQALINTGLNKEIKWGCSATIRQLSPDTCSLMAEAGCIWVGFGIESADPRIREAMRKPGTIERAAEAVKEVRDAGMWANTSYVLGYPGETLESVRATRDWMVDNDCLNSVFHATPYPGTELYDIARPLIVQQWGSEEAYIEQLGDATDLVVNMTDVSNDCLKRWRKSMMEGAIPLSDDEVEEVFVASLEPGEYPCAVRIENE